MDWTPYVGPMVTALIAAGASYAALSAHIARLETRIEHIEREQVDSHALSTQISALAAKVDDLREDVGRHNNLIERTYKLESDMKTQWHRVDELRDGLHEMKVGGTK